MEEFFKGLGFHVLRIGDEQVEILDPDLMTKEEWNKQVLERILNSAKELESLSENYVSLHNLLHNKRGTPAMVRQLVDEVAESLMGVSNGINLLWDYLAKVHGMTDPREDARGQ